MALGLTQQLPTDEKHNYSRDYLSESDRDPPWRRIARRSPWTASHRRRQRLERATELARQDVCEWGMSDAMGPLTFGKKEDTDFPRP